MSAVKNIVLVFLALFSVLFGAVIAYTISIPNSPIQWAILLTSFLLVLMPTLWLYGVVQYFHTKWTNWVDSNQRDDVPAVYTGYDLEAQKRKEFWENTDRAWRQTIIDLTHAEVELRQKTEELDRALTRGARYKFRTECEMASLWAQLREANEELAFRRDENQFILATLRRAQKTNKELETLMAFYRMMNWADKTHQRIVKK